jgi:hypothetical protein
VTRVISDARIQALLAERKVLPKDFRSVLALKAINRQEKADLDLSGASGSRFRLMLRRAELNQLDFSVILAYILPDTNGLLLLRRYNGKSHEHRNVLERGPVFYDYHIHTATERYQQAGYKPEHYAEITNRYADLTGALDCMIADCGFEAPENPQISLFGAGL